MKDIIQNAFVTLVMVALFFPALLFDRTGKISQRENRSLASCPLLIKEGHLNRDIFSEYSAYFDDRFGFRDRLIALNDMLSSRFAKQGYAFNGKAIQGKNGFYFYINANDGDNLRDFYKANLLGEKQKQAMESCVESLVAWCTQNGIKPLFIICPNKHSIYEENFPFPRPSGITRADQIVQILEDMNVEYVFPRDELLRRKGENELPLYYETGTHWNSLGAYYASLLVLDKLEHMFPKCSFPKVEYETQTTLNTNVDDMADSLLSVKTSQNTYIAFTPKDDGIALYSYIQNEGKNGVKTKGADASLPRVIVLRDSFYTALVPFLSPFFSEQECKWERFDETDKDYILEYKPDIIIFEYVERYASHIFE